jgi:hypothetical protein
MTQNQFQAPEKWQIINIAHFNGNKDSSKGLSLWTKSPIWNHSECPLALDNLKPTRPQKDLITTMIQILSSLKKPQLLKMMRVSPYIVTQLTHG